MSPKSKQGGINIENNYLTESEAANYLRTCKQNLRKWRNVNLLKATKVSRNWIYKRTDLDDFFNKFTGKDLSSTHYLNFVKKRLI